jgi:hypothetical protein
MQLDDPLDLVKMLLILAAIVGFLVLSYYHSNDKLKPPFKGIAAPIVNGVWIIVFLLIVGTIVVTAYEAADKDGWFGHDLKVLVWIERDWLPGEFKSCVLVGDTKNPLMYCGDSDTGTRHEMNVEFRGSSKALEAKKQSNCNCQRKELSIACKTE